MQLFFALTAAVLTACFTVSWALETGEADGFGPRIVSIKVLNSKTETVRPPKFSEAIEVHVVDDREVRLLARVEGLETLDVFVSINSRANTGQYPSRALADGLVLTDVPLPDAGSQWASPRPGVDSPMQVVTIDGEQIFVLQVIGDGGIGPLGHRTMVLGQPVLVMRGR